MSDHPQAFWYDLVRRLGHGPDPRPLGREEAWAEYQDAPHADILLMRHLESLSFRDIADVLECPSDLARRRYARALSRLKEHMARARPQGREEHLGTGEHELRRHASDTRPHGPSTQEER